MSLPTGNRPKTASCLPPDHRHRRLLRACRERPRGRCAVGAILSSRSWEDCIVNTSGFDFRYGQVYRWAYDYSVPGAELVPQNQRTVARAA